mmetsp:Transcript_20227/g.17908  ORF Transcript_20227/g.17908 Transcript_20227/m.17908 type:complete len:120 (+) Transcript_20227:361-720(+)|eukprot:CAMPEP_0205801968 /NCGR_PEP_ID=MMETSP0205-20121125/4144_1 /ASSEMBLY_ACC=CAM_ASM_000278 /TAXON_ID=36767 /ORGANISM="Euplotes focardii, Strain TN1" /LENGTH=119 /DNA_ID=CAMNT_0053067621 /DNA_START=358 /DNA_END=717 /DNA_ORIENTATION=-
MNPSKKDILDNYKDVFFNLNDKEINGELLNKIEKFDELLKERLPKLRRFKLLIHKNIEGFRESHQKVSELMTTLGQFEDIHLDYAKDISQFNNPALEDTFTESYKSCLEGFHELNKDQY